MNDLTYLIMQTSQGNPGAVSFCVEARNDLGPDGIIAISKANLYGITGDKLYMLWNDCLQRNTPATCKVLLEWSPYRILEKINYENGYGIPITEHELFPKLFTRRQDYSVFKDEVMDHELHL